MPCIRETEDKTIKQLELCIESSKKSQMAFGRRSKHRNLGYQSSGGGEETIFGGGDLKKF